METKLCRICGKSGQNYVHIFKTEGLKNKIETCLPIIVSPHCLLPETICGECSDNVDNFYSFIKNCLQNIIILEAQYDITESCLKTKRKHDKHTMTYVQPLATRSTTNQHIQTDNYLDVLLKTIDLRDDSYMPTTRLVDYDIDSSSDCEDVNMKTNHNNSVIVGKNFNRRYFDDTENYLIEEISQRKCQKRRNYDNADDYDDIAIRSRPPKIFKMDRRKTKVPKKIAPAVCCDDVDDKIDIDAIVKSEPVLCCHGNDDDVLLPQVCLLCDEQFGGPSMLAAHVFETHGIDMAQIVAGELVEKKKKIPELLKISDMHKRDVHDDIDCPPDQPQMSEEPPTLLPTFVCSVCPAIFTARPDLFVHLRVKHPETSSLLCGMCLYQASTVQNLRNHVDTCQRHHSPPTNRYICQICRYGDDNCKTIENHVLVHEFLLDSCRKQSKMFDPADYVTVNFDTSLTSVKNFVCNDCDSVDFDSFKDFSSHRRSQHSIFHCDLCNKFYGRNSHLWKHVNRLHKGHPSITCQLCYKTSASKYHLGQHFNKIHNSSKQSTCRTGTKSSSDAVLQNLIDNCQLDDDNFMTRKFQGFDFQSVKQSFMRQELLSKPVAIDSIDDNSNTTTRLSDHELDSGQSKAPPKEIDSSSDLYTNIITNYTPPVNEGEFKCPKCGKGFHKKTLVKKHKKNCRPRLQKDLLTRCKSCARIFKDRQSLAKHLVNYHSEYVCEICCQKVQSKCEIVSHIRFAHPGCHLFCQNCGNITRSRHDLAVHLSDHSNSYICQFCGDPLPSKIKLKMHILSLHRKILSLSCGVCLKLFESQHVLRDHVKLVHRDQLSPLTSCTVCGKNYGSKWKTYDHLNKSHGRIFKACKVCLDVFDDDCHLQQHYETSHPNFNVTMTTTTAGVNKNQVAVTTATIMSKSGSDSDRDDSDDEFGTVTSSSVSVVAAAFPEMTVVANKLSLLEKRLLGSSSGNDLNVSPNLSSTNNSSKRTVYVNSNDPSFCEICHKTWPAKKHLWQHYIRCHKSVAATVCGICLKTNQSYEDLQSHLIQTHPNLLHGQGFGSNFICRICGRYHNASSKLKLHMAIHENFDWSLLERKEPNGYDDKNDDDDDDDNGVINYDSLIEQVECSSSDSDDSDRDDEDRTKSDESSSADEEEDSCVSVNSLDANTHHVIRSFNANDDDDNENERTNNSTDSSDDEHDHDSSFSVIKSEDNDDDDDDDDDGDSSKSDSFLPTKSDEIDSAVQSIKYDRDRVDIDDDDDDDYEDDDDDDEDFKESIDLDYCDIQSHSVGTLNDTEIESAVGSIL